MWAPPPPSPPAHAPAHPTIRLCWPLVVDSTPPWENMGHSWHFALQARSSDTMTDSLPAISTEECRGIRSCPEQVPSLIRADRSKILPVRILQRGSWLPHVTNLKTKHEGLRGFFAKCPKYIKQNGRAQENRQTFSQEAQGKVTLLPVPWNPACITHHKWTWQSLQASLATWH